MQDRPEETFFDNPLRHLTTAQFMALGGNAVIYVKPMRGEQLSAMIADQDFEAGDMFQLVVSADGSPLLIADSPEAVDEWLADKNLGVVALH